MNNVYQACLLNKVKEQKLQLELVNCLMGSIDAKKKTGECMAKLKGNSEFNNSFYFRYNMYRIFPKTKNITLEYNVSGAIIFWSPT